MPRPLEKLKLTTEGLIPMAIWNELIDWVMEGRIASIMGGRILRKNRAGTALAIDRSAPMHPFKIINATSETDGARCRIVYGTVSDVVPSGMSAGDDPFFYKSGLVTGPIYLVIPTTDWGDIGTITIGNAATKPVDDFDWESGEGTTYVEIGSVVVDNNSVTSIAQNLKGSIVLQMVGSTPDQGPAS